MAQSVKYKPFAVFDIDGTLIRWQLYHAMADALARQGHFDSQAFEKVRQARMKWKERKHANSYKDYELSLVAAYEQILTNLKVGDFNKAAQAVFDEYKDQVYTYTRNLIQELKQKGYLLFAISGSHTEIVSKIAKYYGFDDYVGTTYVKKNGEFTGKIILANQAKHLVLAKMVKKQSATYKNSLGVGDSESDISMLEAIEKPIAFNPTLGLLDRAKKSGWQVVVERKNVIYKLSRKDGKYTLA